MKKEHLVIIAPRDGSFAAHLSRLSVYRQCSQSLSTTYFVYDGELYPKNAVCNILSAYNFKDFSLDKEGSYYRLRVRVE